MKNSAGALKNNLFELDNARNLSRDQMVQTFVPTQSFWRLLSSKHHVVLGSRGSGKTALAKMLSHDHLSRLEDPRAREIVRDKIFIGIYVPIRLEWVGGLKNKPWQNDLEKELFFQWRFNLSACLAYLTTLRSCLEVYVDEAGRRARMEADLIDALADAWLGSNAGCQTTLQLQRRLEDLEHDKQTELVQRRVRGGGLGVAELAGRAFDADLLWPLRRALTLTSRIMDLPADCSWLVCIDETESLELDHHRILNSHLRTFSGNMFFKMTTMPYCHYTLDTNTPVPLDVGHDFEYVYIDPDPVFLAMEHERDSKAEKKNRIGTMFARTLFNKRAEVSELSDLTVGKLLGPSLLLDDKPGEWSHDSGKMRMLKAYASVETLQRAERLLGSTKHFNSEVSRKLHGALLLRDAVSSQRGRGELDVYSGATMAIRCGDANPRRLIRIFNSLLLEANWYHVGEEMRVRRMSNKTQTRILTKFSNSTLARVQSEPHCGPQLFEFLYMLGSYMNHCLFEVPMTTDQVSSILVDSSVSEEQWDVIKRAVGLGLLFPNIGANNPDEMPEKEGTFHLAYVLAPRFRILPRRGRARRLSAILKFWLESRLRSGTSWDSEGIQGELFS